MTPAEATLAWMRSRADFSLANLHASGTRLGTWLVLGNVAAIVMVMKTVTDGSGCNAEVLSASARAFIVGLLFAFSGWAVGYFNSIASQLMTESAITATSTIVANGDYVERLQREFGKHYQPGDLEKGIDEAGEQIKLLQQRYKWLLAGTIISLILFGCSSASFVHGALLPLSENTIVACLNSALPNG